MVYGRRVLVIDDERVVCNSCRRVLEEEGYEVSVAMDGNEGIKRLSSEDFDAALVDLRMPGVGGMDVVRTVKNAKPEVRIIIMTAYSSISSAVQAMHLGASDYIPKPFTPKELSDRVRRAIEVVQTMSATGKEEAEPAEASRLWEGMERPETPATGARVVLAGSDPDQLVSIGQSLFSEPWQVTTAESRNELLGELRGGRVDVLVLGVDVFGKRAYDLIAEIRRQGSRIPVIVVSADSSLELAKKLREAGIFYYVIEPFDPFEVRLAVHEAIRKAEALREEKPGAPGRKPTSVRALRTLTRSGSSVAFLSATEALNEDSPLYEEIVKELTHKSLPVRVELGRGAVTARELPAYLERDDRVILVATTDEPTKGGLVCYSAKEFETLATREEQRSLGHLAYPEVLNWLKARGEAPELKIVCLPSQELTNEQAHNAARLLVGEGLASLSADGRTQMKTNDPVDYRKRGGENEGQHKNSGHRR